MSTKYYCRIDGNEIGPVDLGEVAAMRKAGILRANDDIRKAPNGSWVSVAYVLDRAARKRKKKEAEKTNRESAREQPTVDQPAVVQPTVEVAPIPSVEPVAQPIDSPVASQIVVEPDPVEQPQAPPDLDLDSLEISPHEIPLPATRPIAATPADEPTVEHRPILENVRWIRNEYVRAALLVNFVIIPFLVPNFGPDLTGIGSFVFAIFSLLLGGVVYALICLPDRRSRVWAFVGAAFTGVFGAATLIQFEELAVWLAPQELTTSNAPLWLVKMMGVAFEHLQSQIDAQTVSGFEKLFAAAVLSAGLCEETLKLIPVAFVIGLGFAKQPCDKRNVLFVGAACGLGFGFSEGLWLTLDSGMQHDVSLSTHLVHFLGRAGGHAALTLVASSVLLSLTRGGQTRTPLKLTALTLVAALTIAIPHGLYNALVIYGMAGLAGLIMLTLVWLVLIASDPEKLDAADASH